MMGISCLEEAVLKEKKETALCQYGYLKWLVEAN